MASSYIVHGDSNIHVEDNIIILESRGPWNAEYFQELHRQLTTIVQDNALTDYGVLLIPLGEAIGVHGAMDSHVNFVRQSQTKAIAINLSRCETPFSTESLCRVLYDDANIKYEFFFSTEEAKQWLKFEMAK